MYPSQCILLALGSFAACCTAVDTLSPPSQQIRGNEPESHVMEERSDDTTVRELIVYPTNGTDNDTNSKTENFLKLVTQQSRIYSFTDSSEVLCGWLVNATNSQIGTIEKNPGSCILECRVPNIGLSHVVRHMLPASPLKRIVTLRQTSISRNNANFEVCGRST